MPRIDGGRVPPAARRVGRDGLEVAADARDELGGGLHGGALQRFIANDSHSRYADPVDENRNPKALSEPPPPASSPEPGRPEPARMTSGALLRGLAEIEIVHGEEIYRLRCTRSGKLILTK